MKRISLILAVLLALGLLIGCSAAKSAEARDYNSSAAYYMEDSAVAMPDAPMEMDTAKTSSAYGSNFSAQTTAPALANRKIIRNANVSVQTLEFDKFIDALNSAINGVGGFVESSSVGGREYYYRANLRSATFVIRIPADSLDAFLDTVDGLGNVTSMSTSMRDVTTNYVDSEKHLEALRTEQDALLEILKSATTVEDIITVQDRLSYVKYEIESYESILRSYDDQIDLSTVTLYLSEVERETVVEKETFGQEVGRRFKESLESVGDFFRDLGAWLFGNAPSIVVFLVFNGVIVLIIVLSIKGGIKRRAKRRAKKLEEQNQG